MDWYGMIVHRSYVSAGLFRKDHSSSVKELRTFCIVNTHDRVASASLEHGRDQGDRAIICV